MSKDEVLKPPVELWNIDMQFDRAVNTSTIPQICQLLHSQIKGESFTPVYSHLLITYTHLACMIALINTTQENRASVLFQPVLKAYPTHHSWMITAHVSLGNIEKQWKLFTRQMIRTHSLLTSLLWKPSALTQLLSAREVELNNLNGIHTSYQPLIQAATQLLKKEPTFDSIPVLGKHMRSLLPFLRDVLSWLTGTDTTKEVNAIKTRINQLITTQQNQQETLAHIISILNITRYATQVNRQHISIQMDTMERTHQGVMTLYNITHSLYSSLSYLQIILHT